MQVEQTEGTVEEISGKEDLHEVIWENIHRKQFYLAEEAPMCSSPLRGIFTYNSVTPTANAISWRGHTNTPKILMRQQKKSSKNAHCVGTLKDGYVRNVPLPRVPQEQRASPELTAPKDRI